MNYQLQQKKAKEENYQRIKESVLKTEIVGGEQEKGESSTSLKKRDRENSHHESEEKDRKRQRRR